MALPLSRPEEVFTCASYRISPPPMGGVQQLLWKRLLSNTCSFWEHYDRLVQIRLLHQELLKWSLQEAAGMLWGWYLTGLRETKSLAGNTSLYIVHCSNETTGKSSSRQASNCKEWADQGLTSLFKVSQSLVLVGSPIFYFATLSVSFILISSILMSQHHTAGSEWNKQTFTSTGNLDKTWRKIELMFRSTCCTSSVAALSLSPHK